MKKILILILVIVLFAIRLSVFQISEMEQGVVVRIGDPIRTVIKPGLYFKTPFIDNIVRFDKRILSYDSAKKEVYTKDKKNLELDNYARWRIKDPKVFLQAVYNERGAQGKIDDIIYSELREEIGKYTLLEVVAKEREKIMKDVTHKSNKTLTQFGIEVVDVRIKRADLPEQNQANVYKRMEAERQQQAKKYRAEGEERALDIRSQANKERTIIIANAQKKSEIIKGEGDALAAQVYNDAYKKDIEFYEFLRKLEAYKKLLKGKGKNTIIVSSDSELWNLVEGK